MPDQKIREAKEVVENKLIPVLEAMFWKGEKEHPEKTELINTCKILKDLAQNYLSIQEPREKKYHKEATDRFQPESCCCQCCQKYHYNQALKDCKLYHLKQMEGLEELIANFKIIDHYVDNREYDVWTINRMISENEIKDLATAIRQKLGGIR